MSDTEHHPNAPDEDLRGGLARLAARAQVHHDPTSAALHRAGQLRARRRVGSLVVGLASIAVAVPVGLNLLGQADGASVDAGGETPTTASAVAPTPTSARPSAAPSPAPAAGPVVAPYASTTISIDVDQLPPGKEPSVPWFADGLIHNGQATTPADVIPGQTSLAPVRGGYLIAVSGEESWRLRLIGMDGTQKLTTPSSGAPVVSKDRRQIAWTTEDGDVKIADASTGKVLRAGRVGPERTVGFLRGQVLLAPRDYARAATAPPAVAWDPTSGRLTSWKDFYGADATDGATLAGVIPKIAQERRADELYCAAVIDTDKGNRERWRVCPSVLGSSVVVRGFSPTGRYAVLGASGEGQTLSDATVADARTGRPLLTVKFQGDVIAWEDDQHILVTALSNGRTAIVRCTLTGTCELATEPRPIKSSSYALSSSW